MHKLLKLVSLLQMLLELLVKTSPMMLPSPTPSLLPHLSLPCDTV